MHELLAVFSLWSLFSIDVAGFPLYPSYLAIPFLYKYKYLKGINKFSLLIAPFYAVSIISKPYIISDVFKIVFMIGYLIYLNSNFKRERLLLVIDISIFIMVGYGMFQYICFSFDQIDAGTWLHGLIGTEGFGGAYDVRNGNLRVASLTKEPSYFAFTTGIYFFITKRRFTKIVCSIGFLLSLSLVSWYAVISIFIFYLLNRYLSLRLFFYLLVITLLHLAFVLFFYELVPPDLSGTFDDRYAGLHYLLSSSNSIDILTGASSIKDQSVNNITRALSNISSLSVNFGVLGLLAYSLFFDKLGKYNKLASLAFFLYSFNFYYLTGWPSYVIFLYLIITNEDNDEDLVGHENIEKDTKPIQQKKVAKA
jgi:hypothetical protein